MCFFLVVSAVVGFLGVGGGLGTYIQQSNHTVIEILNSVFTGNRVSGFGGGLSLQSATALPSVNFTTRLHNLTITDNSAGMTATLRGCSNGMLMRLS